MRLFPRVLLLALALLALLACDRAAPSPAPTPAGTPPAARSDRADWPRVLRVGLVPTEGGADTKLRFASLRECLEKHLNIEVELVSATNYQGVITAMANDQLELAYYGPKSYIEAAKRAKAEPLLVELNKDKERGYRCVFIVPANSPAQSLKDTLGKKFAFTDPNSTSGYLIPAMILLDVLGKPAEDLFSQVTFSGSHSTSIVQVGSGEIDVAATNDLDMNKALQKGVVPSDAVRVVHRSDLIPGSCMAARSNIPDSLKLAMKEALLTLNNDPAALEAMQNGGYEPVTDREYDVIRASQEFLEKSQAARTSGT